MKDGSGVVLFRILGIIFIGFGLLGFFTQTLDLIAIICLMALGIVLVFLTPLK